MFWEKINIENYNFNFELQHAVYLYDLLKDHYEFTVGTIIEKNEVVIYEKKDNGISEKVDIEKLIYFLHYEVPQMIGKRYGSMTTYRKIDESGRVRDYSTFVKKLDYFSTVQKIREAMKNMRIYLKYHKGNKGYRCHYCTESCEKYYECCQLGCCEECRGEGPSPLDQCPFCGE